MRRILCGVVAVALTLAAAKAEAAPRGGKGTSGRGMSRSHSQGSYHSRGWNFYRGHHNHWTYRYFDSRYGRYHYWDPFYRSYYYWLPSYQCYCPVSCTPSEAAVALPPPSGFSQVQSVNVQVGGPVVDGPGPVPPGPVGPTQVQKVQSQVVPPR